MLAYEDTCNYVATYMCLSFCMHAVFQKLQNPTSLNAMIENAREWSTSEERFVHPYQFELENFEPSEEQLQLREPQVRGLFCHKYVI